MTSQIRGGPAYPLRLLQTPVSSRGTQPLRPIQGRKRKDSRLPNSTEHTPKKRRLYIPVTEKYPQAPFSSKKTELTRTAAGNPWAPLAIDYFSLTLHLNLLSPLQALDQV